MDMSQYRDLFLSETREHLNNMNRLMAALEQAPGDREAIDALFREAHSIKGMAASMGFEQTAELSHHLEDFLDDFRAGGTIPTAQFERLLEGVDLLEGLLDDLIADRPERDLSEFMQRSLVKGDAEPLMAVEEAENLGKEGLPPTTVNELSKTDGDTEEAEEETLVFQVLVDLDENAAAPAARGLLVLRELDKFGSILSSKPTKEELRSGTPCRHVQAWLSTSLAKEHIEKGVLKIADVKRVGFVDDRRKDGREDQVRTVRVRTDLLDQFVNLTGELITHRYMLETASGSRDWKELNNALGQAGRLISDLHHNVLQARLMPLESVTARLPRAVRDLSRKTGKKVTLKVVGGEVGIDRMVLEQLSDPLMHLVRNAIDHGIEEEGTVTVTARREKDLVVIEVSDDGSGMNPDILRQKAVEKGFMTEAQVDHLLDRDALMLVCLPGFSTTTEVTETSGRGVGMDVVKAAVEKLGGTFDILSAPGAGTRLKMRLPLSIAIIKILLVSCSGRCLAIPITRVQRTLDLPTSTVQLSGQQRVFELDEDVIPLVTLADLIDLPEGDTGATTWVVLTEVQGRRVGLQVDGFLGQREAFVKSLGFPLNCLPGLSGATVEGNGQILFIVDPQGLLEGHAVVAGKV